MCPSLHCPLQLTHAYDVKVADFGLARMFKPRPPASAASSTSATTEPSGTAASSAAALSNPLDGTDFCIVSAADDERMKAEYEQRLAAARAPTSTVSLSSLSPRGNGMRALSPHGTTGAGAASLASSQPLSSSVLATSGTDSLSSSTKSSSSTHSLSVSGPIRVPAQAPPVPPTPPPLSLSLRGATKPAIPMLNISLASDSPPRQRKESGQRQRFVSLRISVLLPFCLSQPFLSVCLSVSTLSLCLSNVSRTAPPALVAASAPTAPARAPAQASKTYR
jgi:hypothetical protein